MNKTISTILTATALSASFAASAMEFELQTFNNSENKYISMTGDIEEGDVEKFEVFLKDNKSSGAKLIALNSGGGRVGTAEELARIIRDGSYDTLANQYCASACVMVFAGGVERSVIVDKNGKSLGFHLASMADYSEDTKEELFWLGQYSSNEAVAFYTELIGPADTKHLVDTLSNGYAYGYRNENAMYWPKEFEIIKTGLVTKNWN